MTEISRYHNFDLLVSAVDGRSYALRVLTTPEAGDSAAPAVVPAGPLTALGDRLAAFRTQAIGREELRALGVGLFDWLFPPPVRALYRASLGKLGPQDGLRLRLRIEPPELHLLPWECGYDAEAGVFPALDPRTVPVRYLPGPFTRHKLRSHQLSVLVMAASPAGFEPLDVAGEYRRIEDALDLAGGRIQIGQSAGNVDALQVALRGGPNILHFVGHGGYAEQGGGFLWLEDAGRPTPIDGEALAALLRGSSVRLVVLNACESARSDPADSFAGVAPRLVQAGLPAVVAMQAALLDQAALQFSTAFYGALADQPMVDAAVTAARQALFAHAPEEPGWAAPVLFLAAADGVLWEPSPVVVSTEAPPPHPAAGPTFHFNFPGSVTIYAGQMGGERRTTTIHHDDEAADATAEQTQRKRASLLCPPLFRML